MNNKDRYHQAMKQNKGKLNEIELGESIGLDEDTTRKVISTLLSEYKIEFVSERASDYRLSKK